VIRRFFTRAVLAMLLVFGPVEIPAWRADPRLRPVSELVVGGPVLSFAATNRSPRIPK